MLRQNQNIIGYLQKKNFFQKPSKESLSQSKSRFKHQLYLQPPKSPTTTLPPPTFSKTPPRSPTHSMKSSPYTNTSKRLLHFRQQDLRDSYVAERKVQSRTRTYTNQRNFQSSKIESKMCLEDLHHRVNIELNLVDKMISQLTTSMETMVYNQLNQLKQDISRAIEQVFTEARMQLQDNIQLAQDERLKKFVQIKYKLQEKDAVLREMKYQMEVNWKKVAGDMLINETDQLIENVINDSTQMRMKFNSLQQTTPPLHPRDPTLQPLKLFIKEIINKQS